MSKAEQLANLVEHYLMPRYNENLVLMRQKEFKKSKENSEKEFLFTIQQLLEEFSNLQAKNETLLLHGIQFSFLHSSLNMETYEYRISCYTANYFEKQYPSKYLAPLFIYSYLDADKEYFRTLANERVHKIKAHEIEEVLRAYSMQYFQICGMFFLSILPQIYDLPIFQKIKKNKEILILLGGHMDQVIELGRYEEETDEILSTRNR